MFGTYCILGDTQLKRDGRKGEERTGLHGWRVFRSGRIRKKEIGDRKRGMRPSEGAELGKNPRWIEKILDYVGDDWRDMRRSENEV